MQLRLEDYLGKQRDSKAESLLARRLRELDPDEAFVFIWGLLDHEPLLALRLAKRSLRRRGDFEKLLERGFTEADASTVRFWLECCVDRIGPRSVMHLLRSTAAKDVEAARRVLYWSTLVLRRAMPQLSNELDELAAHIGLDIRR